MSTLEDLDSLILRLKRELQIMSQRLISFKDENSNRQTFLRQNSITSSGPGLCSTKEALDQSEIKSYGNITPKAYPGARSHLE